MGTLMLSLFFRRRGPSSRNPRGTLFCFSYFCLFHRTYNSLRKNFVLRKSNDYSSRRQNTLVQHSLIFNVCTSFLTYLRSSTRFSKLRRYKFAKYLPTSNRQRLAQSGVESPPLPRLQRHHVSHCVMRFSFSILLYLSSSSVHA